MFWSNKMEQKFYKKFKKVQWLKKRVWYVSIFWDLYNVGGFRQEPFYRFLKAEGSES